ncbi:hypothetical protein LTR97_012903 [Elasticomyces elasticus]|uniref:Amidohydrolase-related domain-containing protein n=1 Tax=Elasticomyces elasticus TaxID=574655 RepID=A0AAN7VW88_9PEZI|nr:hypothetical protein LTR97_012903 [Elasticomyces elasticus]
MNALLILSAFLALAQAMQNPTSSIITAAQHDGIDLECLPFASKALASIQAIYDQSAVDVPAALKNASKVDVHAHIIPPWYRAIVPTTGQSPTPNWTLETHLSFMVNNSIGHSVLSVSSPGSVVYPGSEAKSAALARLLNEYQAAIVRKLPKLFSFYAVTPLPYTRAAIVEAIYAHEKLGAAGTGLLTNHEGYYLGNHAFTPLFANLNSSGGSTKAIFVHPTGPCLHPANGSLIDANPTLYPEGLVEFYFETARTFMDLTISQTIANFTALRWVVPHGGGSFPSIEDRFITSQPPALLAASKAAYSTRFFWDAAGLVFPHQILGLLGYGVPTSQLVYGSDFPYAPSFSYGFEIAAIQNATFLTAAEKTALFSSNSESIFA